MIKNLGFRLECDTNMLRGGDAHEFCAAFTTGANTERTAIAHTRDAGWFVGTIRITKGARDVRSIRRVLCPVCAWWVGCNG